MKNKTAKEPLMRIAKRTDMPVKQSVIIRAAAVVIALLACGVTIVAITGGKVDFLSIYSEMFEGAFGTVRRIKITVRDTCALLCLAVALAPAFKMRFWNIGAEGQALIGALASCIAVKLFPNMLVAPLLLIMFFFSVLAGALWGIIPGYFKASLGANETLFTLMMNYVAIQLVKYFVVLWEKQKGSGVMSTLTTGMLPKLFGVDYGWSIVIILILTVLSYIYMKYTKHGYEIAVVGESENTARYIGINVKKVIIRTMAISGGLCGLAGFLLVSGTHHLVKADLVGGNGFTAIIVAWLAHLNPIVMTLTSFFVAFLDVGTAKIASACNLNDFASDVVVGVALFVILSSEFFVNYKVIFNRRKKAIKEGE
ncbi:MAG: ABC transporter permease [Acutalibacteraceae bacterium]